ncbi:MAG: DegV family protein [Acidimicrobiales bacterium]
MSVTVVTDSAASLPAGAVGDLGIVVVPMTLVLGGLVYADGDLSPEELVLRSETEHVSTSAPSPGDFLKAIARSTEQAENGGQVLVLTVSSSMSATYEAALTAASYVDDVDVSVIDTATAAGAQGLVVMAAAQMAATGAPLAEVASRAQRVADDVRLMATLRNLDHLARSGRVPQAAAWAGRTVGVQVMFEFSGGKARPRRPARTERGALGRMVEAMVRSRPGRKEGSGARAVLRGAVLEAQAKESAATLHGLVNTAVPEADIFEAPFSSVMVAHTGPDLVGLAWWWEEFKDDGGR